jgi:methionyl-tRNA formyltransferase
VPEPRRLRILFFGTPEIAVPTLERLIAGRHEIVGVVSQPDRGRGRGRKPSPSPVSERALREDLPLLRPDRVGDKETIEALRALAPDLGVVVAFGQFIPKPVRELPDCGYLINAHASLLPKYRGASPIAQAILDGEDETGISVMRIEREMDAGPVALVLRTKIGPEENTAELSARLGELAAEAIEHAVDLVAAGEITWTEQDASLASVAPKIEKNDAILDLRQAARALACRIHALSPKPGGSLRLVWSACEAPQEVGETGGSSRSQQSDGSKGGEHEELLKVSRARVQPFARGETPAPGMIERDSGDVALRIATGDGWLVPLAIQRAGGRAMATADFLRGFTLAEGARFALPKASIPETR